MKKHLLIFSITILIVSCEKNYLVPASEVPKWLKDRIEQDEKIIKSDPKLMQNYGAWIRYKFLNDKYYEYDNPLSSDAGRVYSHDGNLVNTQVSPYTEYWNEKCCEQYIWKAPNDSRYIMSLVTVPNKMYSQ